MENKKLLKYLLKDLSELSEMFTETGKNSFDELEMEFIQNRISGAQKLVQLFLEKENEKPADLQQQDAQKQKVELKKPEVKYEKRENVEVTLIEEKEIIKAAKSPEVRIEEKQGIVEENTESKLDSGKKTVEINTGEVVAETGNVSAVPENEFEPAENNTNQTGNEVIADANVEKQFAVTNEIHFEEEEQIQIQNKRLGDSFLKEKSVNDLMSDDSSKLEHKLSNRPVSSIQAAIGINDRFQYIRELFEGSADNFVKAVSDLDSMEDIKDAVDYLQTNFKWKKNETSLKFINLIKRRFPNE